MTERRQTALMIAAILLASAITTAITWAALQVTDHSSPAAPQRSPTVTWPAAPAHPGKLRPLPEPAPQPDAHLQPLHPAAPGP